MADAVLLTGGTGYLGGHVLAALRRRGHRVRLLARDPDGARALAGPLVEVVAGDVTDRASLDRACAGASGVIHAAATVRSWERDRSVFDRVNVEGLLHVLDAAAAAGIRRTVFVSSFFALGPTDGFTGDEMLEADRGRRFHNDYERTKTLAEAAARARVEAGDPLVTVYPGVLFGPGPRRESNFVAGLVLDAARGLLFGLPGGGGRRWCFTFVEDAADGVVLALEKGAPGSRYLLCGGNATLRDFFDRVAEAGGPRVAPRSIPFALLSAAGLAAEWLARLGGPSPRLTRGAVAIFRHDWAYTSARAERDLGWRCRSLDDGVRALLEGLRADGLLRR